MQASITRGFMALNFALTLLLCLSVSAWSLKTPLRHSLAEANLAQDAAAMLADHGHSHEEAEVQTWTAHGHSHDAADHDHNSALTPVQPRLSGQGLSAARLRGHSQTFAPPPVFGDKPPPRGWTA